MAESVSTVFEKLSETFSAQDVIREELKRARDAADVTVRAAQRALSTLHTAEDLQAQAGQVRDLLKATGEPLKAIENALPIAPGAFHRYADIWHPQLHMASMVAVVLDFVMNGTLANSKKVKEMIGADIQLPIEDYLMGVCNAVAELARLSLNRVIRNDFVMPRKCHEFASNVFEGFKELNLRNDFLRKRYDGMKYDVKKMEDILYDLSIRGLLNGKKRKSQPEDTVAKKMKADHESKTGGEVETGGETKTGSEVETEVKTKTDVEVETASDTKTGGQVQAGGDSKADCEMETNGGTKADGKSSANGEKAAGKDPTAAPMDRTA